MRTFCPVCGGVGTVAIPMPEGTVMCYCGPNGEGWPRMTCPNCSGAKIIGQPDVVISSNLKEKGPDDEWEPRFWRMK